MSASVLTFPVGSDETIDYVGRVRALGPEILATADEIEDNRRIPKSLLDQLLAAGLYRLLIPTCYGGGEVHPVTFFNAISALAEYDGTIAWCVGQANGCAMSAASVPEEVAKEIWGDPSAIVAWGPGRGRAAPHGGGYRLSGSWMFASGGHHATWLGTQSTAILDNEGNEQFTEDGNLVTRTFYVPAEAVKWKDIWDVIGLRGTASDAFTIEDVPVTMAYSVKRDNVDEVVVKSPLYAFRAKNLYAASFSGVALGLARGILEGFKDLATDKKGKYGTVPLQDNAVAQADVAVAEARIRSASAYITSELADIYDDVCVSGALTPEQRMRIRLASTFCIQEAKVAADIAYHSAGATAIFASQPYERRYRDLHAVTQQIQGHKVHYQTVGSYLMGHEPDLTSM
ncbi:MAG: hypothetical protein CMM28_15120 [Rhodospirillaceae bacterium]|nr:hypothetical protein [Rhodospirillaceae bacterium]|tara:strand:- start:572 stop:1771 length:1200 start_codon:yes stop_codon:yes gene_type:complete